MNRNKNPTTWGKRLVSFFYERSRWLFEKKLSKVERPSKATVQLDFSTHDACANAKFAKKISHRLENATELCKVSSVCNSIIFPAGIRKQTLEMFTMKIIAMLERRAIAPHADPRTLVRQAPITATLLHQEQMCILSQTFSPFPGQVVEVQGGFRRDPRTDFFGLPVTDSFKLSVKSNQTGFPYPAQLHGWTLADPLVPSDLHHLEKLPRLNEVLKYKKENLYALQPFSSFQTHASQFLELKEKTFNFHKMTFLGLHKRLAYALCHYKPYDQTTIDRFFESLKTQENPYQKLSSGYQLFNEHFIHLPWQAFNVWRQKVVLNNVHPEDIYKVSRQVLIKNTNLQKEIILDLSQQADSASEKACYLYLLELEKALSPSIHALLLQHRSESLNFTPFLLSPHAEKLQYLLYNHVVRFYNEFRLDPKTINMQQYLTALLNADISLLEAKDFCTQSSIVEELQAYFISMASKQR